MKRKYRVTSRTNTLGRPKGTVFIDEIPKDLERQLIERGALVRVKRGEDVEKTEEKKDGGDATQPTSADRS